MFSFSAAEIRKTPRLGLSVIINPILREFSSANCSEQFGFIKTWTSAAEMTQTNGYPCDHIITNMEIVRVIPDEIKINAGGSSALDHIPLIARLKFKEDL